MQGVLAPVLTPFDSQLNPDPGRFVSFCRKLLDDGCSGLVPFGTTGEANSLSVEERERLLDALLEGGVPAEKLIPGTGCAALPDTVRLSKKAARAGCAGVLVLPPFYYKNPSEEGLYRSFARAIDKTGEGRLRVYLYHIPQVSQVGISLRLIERLLKAYPGVVTGIKDSSLELEHTRALLRAFPGFEVFVGTEKFLLATLREGGAGCITATANVKPLSCSRSADLRNFPVAVRGICVRKTKASGSQNLAKRGSSQERSSPSEAVAPSLRTTHATGRSDHFGCETATTAASFTAGWPIRAFSISTELIHSPPLLIRALERSVMRT